MDIGAIQGFTDAVLERFKGKTSADSPAEYFNYDFRCLSLKASFGGADPRIFHGEVEPETVFDEWGVGHWAGGASGTYEKMYPPLAAARSISEVEVLPAPALNEAFDQAMLNYHHGRGYPVFGYAGSIYEWSWWLRGMENFLADLLLDTGLAEAVIHKVSAFTHTLALASARAGIDVLCFYDDAGMQTGLQLSPELWRRFIKPRWREVLEAVRSQYPGCLFYLHSCGDIREIIPDIVELGFHILHPVQPECMDLREVRGCYGRQLVLCASLSAQRTLPFGTPAAVRGEVRRLKELFAEDGRCILCPSNRIQPETPWENILAFAEEARAL